MTMLSRPLAFAACAFLIGVLPASAQRSLELDDLDALFSEEARVEVNLQGPLLRLVAEASRAEEPEFAAMVDAMRGIFVRQYALSTARSGVSTRVRDMARSLESSGWQTLVRVREDDEDIFIYLLPDGDIIDGLVVMALNSTDDEATFVTFEGRIDPEQIGRLGARFNIDALERAGG
ncbi:MAG: DUF4252 domain-containing protein [Rhodothermaceae bacterium]|nr:DUF4252 domain-containing protein [Rhodothermaceae bacterium]